ncbi:MAG: hypothetical protein KJ060_14735 [Candidatus Hydrogenedentes bacterium]|nr:hypothetical protein [Candidatus Hydrogenedentota bacterium]
MTILTSLALCCIALTGSHQDRYYAHDTVLDSHGVIAPWYTGLNGQFDFRVRVAAETLKRYPWAVPPKSCVAAPEYVFNGTWRISPEGDISVPDLRDWDNGDLGQRAAYILGGFVDYYRYSGDPAAIAHITCQADFLLDHCQTGPDHPWPRFLISVPTKGTPYGEADPHGMMQLDIAAEVGIALLQAYQLTGESRWFDACKNWGDQLASHRDSVPGMSPWNRYANPEDVQWDDRMTGGVAFLLTFFDELIELGYTGNDNAIVKARDAGRTYLREVLLPKWTVDDTWGRNYWDWPDPVQAENVTEFAARYIMDNPDVFPNWKTDVRNILTLFLNRTGVSPASNGDTYSGAWAFPESSGCCRRSLWYGPMEIATVLAEFGVRADAPWAVEMARRMQILATYDVHETGVVEDNIDGGAIVAGSWFKITHPMPLKHVLGTMAWLPDVEGANRENHILRSSRVVNDVSYGGGRIAYSTFDAPAHSIDLLRLSYRPNRIAAGDTVLFERTDLDANGYTIQELSNGDCLVSVRHDGATHVFVEGPDPQHAIGADTFERSGLWKGANGATIFADTADASAELSFSGNQVRVIGGVGPDGGLAKVYVDGVEQRAPIDCWNPRPRSGQVLYYTNGLTNGEHRLKVIVQGVKNPVSEGTHVWIEGVQWSAEEGSSGFGEGGGSTETQRMIFGYAGGEDYVDTDGHAWRPATEWVTPLGHLADVVAQAWNSNPQRLVIEGTSDPEIYRYGARAPEFWTNLTVGPGTYYVRLKFADTFQLIPKDRALTILINGDEVVTDMDIGATAGGQNRAVDLVFNDIQPRNGIIEVRFVNRRGGEAIVQALEIGSGHGGDGAVPVAAAPPKEPAK